MIGALLRLGASALARTWRFETVGRAHLDRLRAKGRPFIFALWHSELLPLLWFHRGVPTTVMTSRHRDGRYVADTARRWGFGVIEGSSRRGGVGALRRAVRVLAGGGEVAIAVDGPTGPRHEVKPGIVVAARLGGVQILPVVAVPSAAWRVRSWDRFQIPKPFCTIRIGYGAPLSVPGDRINRHEVADEVQSRLSDTGREAAA